MKGPGQPPHPYAVYLVITIAVLLSLTIFTPANINAAVTGLAGAPQEPPQLLKEVKVCGGLCGDIDGRIGVYSISNDEIKCVSVEEFQNNRYCCYDLDCPLGSACVSGVCE